jgi:hypothetical protein
MTDLIKVYPTKESALNVRHPSAGAARVEGVDWPNDVFTARRLTDGSFTTDPAKAFKSASMKKAASDLAAATAEISQATQSADASAAAKK